jgi:uncharacterized protein YqgV (UPF0045/DUF77 family)
MRSQSDRVVTYVKIDDKEGVTGAIRSKVSSVEREVGHELNKG